MCPGDDSERGACCAQAKLVYDAILGSGGFYASPVAPDARSNMNIPFTIPSDPALEKAFLSEATQQGMVRASPAHLDRPSEPASTRWSTCPVVMLLMLGGGASKEQH